MRPRCGASTPALSAFLWASVPTASSFVSEGHLKAPEDQQVYNPLSTKPCQLMLPSIRCTSTPHFRAKGGVQPACKYPSVGSLTPYHTPLSHRVKLLLPMLAAGFIAPFWGLPRPTSSRNPLLFSVEIPSAAAEPLLRGTSSPGSGPNGHCTASALSLSRNKNKQSCRC